jgi:hemerythrin-like metal-binding protein
MINLNNLKTGKRLAIGFGTLAVLLLLLSATAWWEMSAINKGMDTALTQQGKLVKLKDVATALDNIYLDMWGLVTAKDATEKQARQASIEARRTEYRKWLAELKAAAASKEDKDLLANLEAAVDGSKDINQRVTDMALKADGLDAKALEVFEAEGEKQMREKIDPAIMALTTYREKRVGQVDDAAEAAYLRGRWVMGIGALVAFGLAGLLGTFITRSIVLPIKDCVGFTDLLAKGDFSQEMSEAARHRGDEMGDLARAFHTMVSNTRKLLREVTGGVQTLASSATELSAVSSQTTNAVRTMSEKTATVAAAAEEASANTTSVAASMEQAATNLASVASATEEMSATVGEIASNSEKARNISDQATVQAQTISALMQELGRAAQEIGKVTETITDISSQTNLLALNATIEAARAGAAGKGFAVVANEIKELARQTATATEDIKAKISGVQTSAGGAIADIEKISGVIKEVSAIVSSIAASIEEQAAVTKDVAGNIAQASAGVKDSNERIAQTATVSKDIARDMTGVNTAVGDIRQGGEQVSASTVELSKLAEQLKATVGLFKVDNHSALSTASTRSGPTRATGSVATPAAHTSASHGAAASIKKEAEAVLIPWKEDYAVGVLAMDSHHQKLISLINRLHAALKQGAGTTVAQGILKELMAYTQYHFKAEEELMAKCNFGGLEAQQKVHGEFLRVVTAARDRWQAGDASVPRELLVTLEDWLVKHITNMDKQYGPCIIRHMAGAKDTACPLRTAALARAGGKPPGTR